MPMRSDFFIKLKYQSSPVINIRW